jgi:hypothetical protein
MRELWYYIKLDFKDSVLTYFEPLMWLWRKLK